jgi:glycosyltransferase involved in cell wall biosynthesis
LAQDYSNFEIVIADDCSTDGTEDLVRRYEEKHPGKIRFKKAKSNQGITKNCNMAWMACKGEWIKTIAGDDKLMLDCLSTYVDVIGKSREVADIYFAKMRIINDEKSNTKDRTTNPAFFQLENKEILKKLYENNIMLAPTSFINRKVLISVSYADERFEMIEDYPLWVKLAEANFKFGYVDRATVLYRLSESLSQRKKTIGNLRYLNSLYRFQRTEIWPKIGSHMFLRMLSDAAVHMQKVIGIKYLNNNKNLIYMVLCLLLMPAKIYRVYKKTIQMNFARNRF